MEDKSSSNASPSPLDATRHSSDETPAPSAAREAWARKVRWAGYGRPRIWASDFCRDDEAETEVAVFYTYLPGCPEAPPAYEHGGLPADPPEVEIEAVFAGDVEVELTDAERERMTLWLLENPPEDDEP